MRLILSRVLYRYDLHMTDGAAGFAPETQKAYFLWEKKPLLIRVSQRT